MSTLFVVLLSLGGLWILFVIVRWIFKTTQDVVHTTKRTLDIEKSIKNRDNAILAATKEHLRKKRDLYENNSNEEDKKMKKKAFTPLERKLRPLSGAKNTKQGSSLKANPHRKKASLQLSNGAHQSFLSGFTIIELLTVMSIIIILISLLVPSLNMMRRIAREVVQRNQFRNISTGLGMFESDFEEYPDSSQKDVDGAYYPGAMKLCEVMAGQDGLGFHLDSRLCINGLDKAGNDLYPDSLDLTDPCDIENLRSRKEYLEARDIQICKLSDLYDPDDPDVDLTKFPDPDAGALLCDVFRSVRNQKTGKKMGMPVLYYRADTSKLLHDPASFSKSIYDCRDNMPLLSLGLPSNPTEKPPLYKRQVFYEETQDRGVLPIERPHNKDSFILISAGWDGIYGTKDDVYNFAE